MTAITAQSASQVRHATFSDVLASEWLKVRTVRSTVWTLVALAVVTIGLSGLIAALAAGHLGGPGPNGGPHPSELISSGTGFGQIAALVLGVLVVSSEYSSGMIHTSLIAMPRRLSVMLSKILVLAAVMLVVGLVTSFISYFVSEPSLSSHGHAVALSDPGVIRALIGNGLYFTVLSLFGFALGLMLRHTAGAITTGLALIFVIGNVVGLLPGSWGDWVYKLMPGNAGSEITQAMQFGDPSRNLTPWGGFAVFCAETALLLIIGGILFHKRDA